MYSNIKKMDYQPNEFNYLLLGITGISIFITLVLMEFFNWIFYKEEEEDISLENVRDYIESFITDLNYKEIESVILPKKGDYVRILGGSRWQNCIGRITNTVENIFDDSEHPCIYNINISKQDNPEWGNDIPRKALRNKDRSFFKILTDYEIDEEEILDEDEYINRYTINEAY
jgi:hypothetical protein